MPGGNVMGGVPFLGVYLSVEPMIFTPVHPIMGFPPPSSSHRLLEMENPRVDPGGETLGVKVISGSVCKVRTQDTDNFDEEVKPLASAR